MSEENELMVQARRYFSQAGQSSDLKKMKLLADLGLEFLKLAHEDAVLTARANAVKQRYQTGD